jgi:hypothetical protein
MSILLKNLVKDNRVRVRRLGSTDDWCMCRIELVSPNKMSMGLRVEDGAVRPLQGGIVTGFLPVSMMRNSVVEISSKTELEIELVSDVK